MELTIRDLQNLMFNGGINVMREELNYKLIICEEIKKLQNRVKKEFEEFKHEIDTMSTDDVIYNNYKIYTYCNLYHFFIDLNEETLYDLLIVKLLEEKISKDKISYFLLIENIIFQLYDADLSYDSGPQTGTFDNIINLIIDFCNILK